MSVVIILVKFETSLKMCTYITIIQYIVWFRHKHIINVKYGPTEYYDY